jgi:uncharacterized protein (DUF2147 family)
MKKIIVLFIIFTGVTAFCFSDGDPVEGFWISVDEKTNRVTAGWQVYRQDGRLYGKILSIATQPRGITASPCRESYPGFPVPGRVNQMEVAGTPWIYGLSMHRTGEWRGGKIINPEDGNIYNCRITFRPADGRRYTEDTLEMRGEIGLGIGRSQFWRRTDEQTASGLWPD